MQIPPQEKDIAGDWTGEKGLVWHIRKIRGSNDYAANYTADGKAQNWKFTITTIGNDTVILWAEDKELSAYLPFRVASGGEDAVVLLYPDEEEFKRFLREGKITAQHDKDKNAWVVSKGDWTSLLESKNFWRIDLCVPFIKITKANQAMQRTPFGRR
jgi:hypothetical protein